MKKFFPLLLLCVFIVPFKADALSFNDCHDESHEVEYHNYEDFRDWCYFKYYDSSLYSDLIVYHKNHETVCLLPKYGTDVYFSLDDFSLHARSPFEYRYIQIYNFDMEIADNTNSGIDNLMQPTTDFSSINISNSDNTLYFSSNFTFDTIKNKYSCNTQPDEPDDPTPDDPTPDEPDDSERVYPINTNDYYLGIMLFSLLIWLLYFKWCFPMKGGKK